MTTFKTTEILKKIENSNKFVDDFAGFNFKKVADTDKGAIFRFMCFSGVGFCLREDEGDRFKHCKAILTEF